MSVKRIIITATTLWLLSSLLSKLEAQTSLLYVTSVQGDVRLTDQKMLKVQDTLAYSQVKRLSCLSGKGIITLLGTNAEGFKAIIPPTNDMSSDLILIKSKSEPLRARSTDCICATIEDCLGTNLSINDRLILFDTISFPVSSDIKYVDSFFYFLQWKSNGKVFSNRLKTKNDNVLITRADLFFNEKYYDENDSNELSLGIWKSSKGEKPSVSLLKKLKIIYIDPSVLKKYYETLQQVMKNDQPANIYETYYSELYQFFGKPNRCRLNQLINYNQ